MPRTTLNIDASVLAELKDRAALERRSLGDLVSEAVARQLAEHPPPDRGPFSWVSTAMGARMDISDKERVRDALDQP